MGKSIEQHIIELYEIFKLKDGKVFNKAMINVCIELDSEEKISELIYGFNNLPAIVGSKCILAYIQSRAYLNCSGVSCRTCHERMPERIMKVFNKPPKEYRREN